MAINALGMGVIWQPVNWVWMHYGNQCISLDALWQSMHWVWV